MPGFQSVHMEGIQEKVYKISESMQKCADLKIKMCCPKPEQYGRKVLHTTTQECSMYAP